MSRIKQLIEQIVGPYFLALVIKETREILRNKYLVFLLLVPPILQLLILGASLDPQVRNLTIAFVDYSKTAESRAFIRSIEASCIFPKRYSLRNEREMSRFLCEGRADLGLVVPATFVNDLNRDGQTSVLVAVDGADAYSAKIASAYILRIIDHYRPAAKRARIQGIMSAVSGNAEPGASVSDDQYGSPDDSPARSPANYGDNSPAASQSSSQQEIASISDTDKIRHLIDPHLEILYNPGQLASWYFVPGVLGATLTLTATLVASATILRERESGTMDQLLMTPAETVQIWLAKVTPLVSLLLCDVCLAVGSAMIAFGLPFRGNFLLFLFSSALYIFNGIGLGMLLGTLCKTQQQAQLTSFFINIPLIQLSGTVVPFDTMPKLLQSLAVVNPLKYYATIARGVILKGNGLNVLWPDVLILCACAVVVLVISMSRFRRQIA